jgi:two-component system sensor kinase FixL
MRSARTNKRSLVSRRQRAPKARVASRSGDEKASRNLAGEKLRSANEGLQSAKDEMQSRTEGLPTAQMQDKIEELERANDDLHTLLIRMGTAAILVRRDAEAIVEAVVEGVLVLDRDLRVLCANRSFCEMFQVSRNSTQGRVLSELGGGRWNVPGLRTICETLQSVTRAPGPFEVERVLPSGELRTLRLTGRLLDAEEPAGRLLLTIEDVTERRRSQHALEQSEACLRGIFDSAVDGIITIDERGTILSFNRAAEHLFGYLQAEVLGKHVRMLMPLRYRDDYDRGFRRYLSTRQGRVIGVGREVAGRRKNGNEFPMELSVSEYHDGGGFRFTGIMRDLSERKEAQYRLRQREAELAHAQRLQTVGELAAGLAHELAQPLAAVSNEVGACVRFVQTGHLDPRRLLTALERASNEAERAGQILQHLRQLVEKRPAEFQIVDLRDVVSAALELVRHTAEHARIRLRLDVDQRPLSVKADRIQIEQVLVNLLQNAIEAIETAGGTRRAIDVACRQSAPRTAGVAIRDSGPGLATAARAKFFEPFFTTKPHGLGIGLAISRRIIEAHQGRIWVESPRAARGTSVRFTLPLQNPGARATRRCT